MIYKNLFVKNDEMNVTEKMGKNKRIRKDKNVFKVATARSIKLKAKAQKMATNLKKVSDEYLRILN